MPPKVEAVKTATFDTDDKRAQYARLVVFNHGVKHKIIGKDKDVNSVSNGDLQKAFKDLVGGTYLDGKDGIVVIQQLSKKGSTTGRELTTAYAQEVRPFIRRGALSAQFGRRGKAKAEATATENGGATTTTKTSSSKSTAGKKPASRKPAAKKPATTPAPAPEPTPEPEQAAA
jgi:hypothetical protein